LAKLQPFVIHGLSARRPPKKKSPDQRAPLRLIRVRNSKSHCSRSLFRGWDDVYASRWEGKSGKIGYSPAGIREWEKGPSTNKAGHKKQFRLSKLFPLTEEVVRDHFLDTRSAKPNTFGGESSTPSTFFWYKPL